MCRVHSIEEMDDVLGSAVRTCRHQHGRDQGEIGQKVPATSVAKSGRPLWQSRRIVLGVARTGGLKTKD